MQHPCLHFQLANQLAGCSNNYSVEQTSKVLFMVHCYAYAYAASVQDEPGYLARYCGLSLSARFPVKVPPLESQLAGRSICPSHVAFVRIECMLSSSASSVQTLNPSNRIHQRSLDIARIRDITVVIHSSHSSSSATSRKRQISCLIIQDPPIMSLTTSTSIMSLDEHLHAPCSPPSGPTLSTLSLSLPPKVLRFRSRRIKNKDDIQRPWLEEKPDPREKCAWIFPLCGMIVGFIMTGFMCYLGLSKVPHHEYCPVLMEDFKSGVLDPKVWTQEVQVGGFGLAMTYSF
jgi:hypothetical protein